MNKSWRAVMLFVLLCAGFVAYLGATASLLPERVASHFNVVGEPDGWMSRNGYLWFEGFMGVGLPLFLVGMMYLCRFLPDWTINLPHKEYWLSPEQRPRTYAWILRHSFWLSSLLVGLMGAGHYLTLQANRSVPVRLPGTAFVAMMAGFLAGMAIWMIALWRRFRKP